MAGNLTIGLLMMIACLAIQCTVVGAVLKLLRRFESRNLFKPTLPRLITILTAAMLCMLFGNLIQMSLWAMLFMSFGELPDFETALYHSMVNFTSLGYGDLVLSPERRLLGALEAANGVMMFGLSTSVLIAVLNALLRRMRDHRAHAESPSPEDASPPSA